MNPGPAISILRTRPCGSWRVATSRSATARGFCLSDLASVSARLVATSPCAGSRGRSSSTADGDRDTPAAPRHPPGPRGSPRAPSLVAGVFFLLGALGGLRLGRGLRLGAGFRLGVGLGHGRGLGLLPALLFARPLVVGDVEARALEIGRAHV